MVGPHQQSSIWGAGTWSDLYVCSLGLHVWCVKVYPNIMLKVLKLFYVLDYCIAPYMFKTFNLPIPIVCLFLDCLLNNEHSFC